MKLKAEQIQRAIKTFEGARVIVANRDFDEFQDAIITAINALSLIKQLTEENERLRELGTTKEIEKEIVRRETKADTVRKMQERFIAEIEQTPNANEHFIKAWKSKIDQIAKEMLEGYETIGDNVCVVCGEIIPEGRQYCPICEDNI